MITHWKLQPRGGLSHATQQHALAVGLSMAALPLLKRVWRSRGSGCPRSGFLACSSHHTIELPRALALHRACREDLPPSSRPLPVHAL